MNLEVVLMYISRKESPETTGDRAPGDRARYAVGADTGPGTRARLAQRRSFRVAAGAAAAVMAVFSVVGGVLSTSAGPADASSRLSWAMTGGNIAQMNQQDPATTSYFFSTPASYGTGSSLTGSPVQSSYATTRVLGYTSYAQFSSDINSGSITYPYKWVMYDPEAWAQTPVNERQDPVKYMQLFGQLAHANGLKVIQAPARDLAYVSGSVYPRLPRESADQWFVRIDMAGTAAASGDIFDLQDEANTANLSAYDSLFTKTQSQALAANSSIQVFSEVSTVNGTPDQMAAAAKSVSASGIYVAAPGAIPQAVQFIQNMKAAGY